MASNADMVVLLVHLFTPDSARSKIDKFSKTTNMVKLINKQYHSKVLLISFPMNGHTLKKVRKLFITHGFTLGVVGLKLYTTAFYSELVTS